VRLVVRIPDISFCNADELTESTVCGRNSSQHINKGKVRGMFIGVMAVRGIGTIARYPRL
jgi:hypothetical protein